VEDEMSEKTDGRQAAYDAGWQAALEYRGGWK